ncbi:MAG TPA: hypothetical protein VGH28_17035 [Polyangiaceae bacterium]|jgi:hypothetical protein
MRVFYIFLILGCALAACGGDDSNPGTDDAQTGDETDLGDAGDTVDASFPAIKVDAPQVVSLGGPVESTPTVQPVFFPGFDYGKQITDFTSKLGASSYWAPLAEYKVGKIVAATPITLTAADTAPAQIFDSQIQTWLASRFDGTHPEFGNAPAPNTIYALFYPSTTTIYLTNAPPPDGGVPDGGGNFGNSASCKSFGGYHSDFVMGSADVAYAVLPECPTFGNLTGADVSTSTTSHELSEAATDPYPMTQPAYTQVDDNHLAWEFFLGGGEVGDMCAQFPQSFYVPSDLPYMVQKNWSNASAKAGHDPCQPVATTPAYFNAMPVFTDSISTRGVTTKGVDVPVGQSKTVELDLFSDGPMNGPWNIDAQAFTRGGTAPISFKFDKASGQNGDKIMLTVTSTSAIQSTSKTPTATIVVTSSLGAHENVWIGILGQQ